MALSTFRDLVTGNRRNANQPEPNVLEFWSGTSPSGASSNAVENLVRSIPIQSVMEAVSGAFKGCDEDLIDRNHHDFDRVDFALDTSNMFLDIFNYVLEHIFLRSYP
jgi:hypothetical protein